MSEKRFTIWGNRIKMDGELLNINFETKIDAKLCCKLLNQLDKDKLEYLEKVDELNKWHKEHYGKSILDERLEFKSPCEKENEQLKQQIKNLRIDVLDSVHEADEIKCTCNPCVVEECVKRVVE